MTRYVCTKLEPWDEAKHGAYAVHPDAVDDGESHDGTVDYYKCPHCGKRFGVELPE